MRRVLPLVLVLLLSMTSRALHAEERGARAASYQAALEEGRRLAARGEPAAAVVAFQRTLARAARNPALAEEATRKAISASSGDMKAAALHTLALILEDRGDVVGAQLSLRDSLEVSRDNTAVRKALDRVVARHGSFRRAHT